MKKRQIRIFNRQVRRLVTNMRRLSFDIRSSSHSIPRYKSIDLKYIE